MVKKTVNQDDPTVYHLFYADERGSAGADITFFEYPGSPRGRAGDGMVHLVSFRVGSEESLEFWRERVGGVVSGRSLVFEDPEGLKLELVVDDSGEPPLIADAPDIPEEHRLRGFAGARAYASQPERSNELLVGLGFEPGWEVRGDSRSGFYRYDAPPEQRGLQGAGTVHHIAWSSKPEEHEAWRARVFEAGGQPTPVIDRFYFKSIYFREPSGVLFEIATMGPGFTSDEPSRDARRIALAAAELRAVPRPGRADPHAAAGSARGTLRVIVRERPAEGEAAGALVLFHGRGADENDLFPLLDVLDPERRLDGYCPRGPLSLPPGGAHWYIVPRVGYPDRADLHVVVCARRRSGSTRCRTRRSCSAGSRRGA